MWPFCSDMGGLWLLAPLVLGLVFGYWTWADDGPSVRHASNEGVDQNREFEPSLTRAVIGIPAAVGPSDDLLRIKGIGPTLSQQLAKLGVRQFGQIAAWRQSDIALVEQQLGGIPGRIVRDSWVGQAASLARSSESAPSSQSSLAEH